jgi:hypothetical protein
MKTNKFQGFENLDVKFLKENCSVPSSNFHLNPLTQMNYNKY